MSFNSVAQGVGTQAQDFTHNTLDHGQISLSEYAGKLVYLFFFGWGLPTCQGVGTSTETQINQVYQDQNFQAIGLDHWNGTVQQVRTFQQLAPD